MSEFSADGKFQANALKMMARSFVELGQLDTEPDLTKYCTEKFLLETKSERLIPSLAFFMNSMEEQNRLLGRDPRQYGLNDISRNNVATVLRYTNEQGLTSKPHSVDEMFHAIDDWAWTGTRGIWLRERR